MLAMFLASLVVSGFNSKQLAHELAHDSRTSTTMAAADHNHDHALPLSTNDNSNPEPLSDIEHRILHVVHYYDPLPSSNVTFIGAPPARTKPLLLSMTALPPAEREPPFRPPRTPALI